MQARQLGQGGDGTTSSGSRSFVQQTSQKSRADRHGDPRRLKTNVGRRAQSERPQQTPTKRSLPHASAAVDRFPFKYAFLSMNSRGYTRYTVGTRSGHPVQETTFGLQRSLCPTSMICKSVHPSCIFVSVQPSSQQLRTQQPPCSFFLLLLPPCPTDGVDTRRPQACVDATHDTSALNIIAPANPPTEACDAGVPPTGCPA